MFAAVVIDEVVSAMSEAVLRETDLWYFSHSRD